MKTAFNFKNRLFSVVLILVVLSGLLFNAFSVKTVKAENREIDVFSCEDYIDESLLDTFKQETGITVNYYTFAGNEEMYNELTKAPDSCNLLCLSEYMILKMQSEDLIKPFNMPQVYKENVSPYIDGMFDSLGFYTSEGKTYACGYMWGTMGFVYNTEKYSAEDLNYWSVISDAKLKNKVTIKDSIRDTYIMAVGAVYKDELESLKQTYDTTTKEYNKKLTEIFNRRDDETIEKVENFLQEVRQNLYGFEVDSGKTDMITGKIDVNFAWSGDAVYSMNEADEVDVTLGYVVPEEGSNVWFDGYVMSKSTDAQKEKDCVEFLNYISKPESAVANMSYIGYTSVIAGDLVFQNVIDWYGDEDGTESVDLKYFFDPTDTEGKYIVKTSESGRQLYAQYFDEETINRCAVMDNFGSEDLARINAMWNRVKLITLSNTAIILIVSAIALLLVLITLFKFKNKIFKLDERVPEKRARKVKKGLKVIKVQKL